MSLLIVKHKIQIFNHKFLWIALIILLLVNITTGGKQTPGSILPSFKGFSATPPIAMSASDSASSTSKSGISSAKVTITDEKKQKELTGRSVSETIANINANSANVITGKDTTNALKPIFDKRRCRVPTIDNRFSFELIFL